MTYGDSCIWRSLALFYMRSSLLGEQILVAWATAADWLHEFSRLQFQQNEDLQQNLSCAGDLADTGRPLVELKNRVAESCCHKVVLQNIFDFIQSRCIMLDSLTSMDPCRSTSLLPDKRVDWMVNTLASGHAIFEYDLGRLA